MHLKEDLENLSRELCLFIYVDYAMIGINVGFGPTTFVVWVRLGSLLGNWEVCLMLGPKFLNQLCWVHDAQINVLTLYFLFGRSHNIGCHRYNKMGQRGEDWRLGNWESTLLGATQWSGTALRWVICRELNGHRPCTEKAFSVSRSSNKWVLTMGSRLKLWKATLRQHGGWDFHLWGWGSKSGFPCQHSSYFGKSKETHSLHWNGVPGNNNHYVNINNNYIISTLYWTSMQWMLC